MPLRISPARHHVSHIHDSHLTLCIGLSFNYCHTVATQALNAITCRNHRINIFHSSDRGPLTANGEIFRQWSLSNCMPMMCRGTPRHTAPRITIAICLCMYQCLCYPYPALSVILTGHSMCVPSAFVTTWKSVCAVYCAPARRSYAWN